MFEKLIASLPYNPSLVHQLGFYAKRMRSEAAIRRTGFIFIVLSFLIQFFAVVAPPQPTVAYSTNDMINGGVQGPGITDAQSQAQIVSSCQHNVKSYGDVLWNFGITCNDVARAGIVWPLSSTSHDKQLYSMGWLPVGAVNPNTGKATGESLINLAKVTAPNTLYGRLLWSWDSYDHSDYKALQVTSSVTGKTYFILFTCGNLVSIGVPTPLPRCQYNQNLLATDSQCFKPCQYNTSIAANSPQCYQPCQYNAAIPASSSQCFAPCPLAGLSNIPKTSTQCVAPCPYNKSLAANSPQCFQPCQYNNSISATSPECFPPCKYNKTISATSGACQPPCQYIQGIPSSSPECKPCDKSIGSQDLEACVAASKTATDTTQGWTTGGDGQTAQPGDTIVYTLKADNSSKAPIQQFVMQESLSDVLDYADVVSLDGGSMDSNGIVVWPAITLNANTAQTHTITVKVKDQIPQTPPSSSDPTHYDHIMTNVYGNAININVPGGVISAVAVTSTSLPNTGPGNSLIVAGIIVIIAGYFFARARLLADESTIVLHENTTGGM